MATFAGKYQRMHRIGPQQTRYFGDQGVPHLIVKCVALVRTVDRDARDTVIPAVDIYGAPVLYSLN